jgi:hypothetical protein
VAQTRAERQAFDARMAAEAAQRAKNIQDSRDAAQARRDQEAAEKPRRRPGPSRPGPSRPGSDQEARLPAG